MAKAPLKLRPATATVTVFSLILFMFLPGINSGQQFSRAISREELGLKKEKLSHLHFYFHDIVGGQTPTAFHVAEAAITNTSKTSFGILAIMDDPLTEGPDSKLVGRSQGIYASASLDDISYFMALNFVFVEGKYNGSTLSLLGKNSVFSEVREMGIVGGSGVFRFARGYAEARTHSFSMNNNGYSNAVVEYDVYVSHY